MSLNVRFVLQIRSNSWQSSVRKASTIRSTISFGRSSNVGGDESYLFRSAPTVSNDFRIDSSSRTPSSSRARFGAPTVKFNCDKLGSMLQWSRGRVSTHMRLNIDIPLTTRCICCNLQLSPAFLQHHNQPTNRMQRRNEKNHQFKRFKPRTLRSHAVTNQRPEGLTAESRDQRLYFSAAHNPQMHVVQSF